MKVFVVMIFKTGDCDPRRWWSSRPEFTLNRYRNVFNAGMRIVIVQSKVFFAEGK